MKSESIRNKIMQYLKEHEILVCPVSIRELQKHIGGRTSTSTIKYHLDQLERQQRIIRQPHKSRFIQIKESQNAENEVNPIEQRKNPPNSEIRHHLSPPAVEDQGTAEA